MQPTDLGTLRAPSRPTLSPDGSTVVFAWGGADLEADDYVSHLFIARPGATAQELTHGHSDTAPVYSPDGRWVAFLRREPEGKAQLWVLPTAGGEPRQLTDAPLGVSQPQWSTDSRRLAYLARVPDAGRYDPDKPAGKEAPRRVTSLQYRMNGVGYTLDKPQHLHVLDVADPPSPSAEPEASRAQASEEGPGKRPVQVPVSRQLTQGEVEVETYCWMEGDERLAVVASLHQGHDRDLVTDLALVPAAGGELEMLPGIGVSPGAVTAGPGCLYFLADDLGSTGTDFVARNAALFRYDLAHQDVWQLTEPEDIELHGGPGALVACGRTVYVLRAGRGAVELVAVDGGREREGSDGVRETIVRGAVAVASFDVSRDGATVAVAVSRPDSPGEIEVYRGGDRVAVSASARDWCAPWVRTPVELTVTSGDGYPVHGWVVTPATPGPHPVVLQIHGGPYTQYGPAFFDEFQVWARAGYAVVACNPRGSSGYGQAHGRAIKGRMGSVDAADVLAFLDGALANKRFALDDTRVAVMGGSYGGYMTGWLTTQTARFACAVVERGFLDAVSFVGSSDIGWYFGREYLGPDAASAAVAAQNPMAHIGSVVTPTLVIHSENDLRCPIEQGQRWFTELKLRGVETEMLIFPGENHELSRSGLPSHRVARFEAILQWLGRHLQAAPAGEPTDAESPAGQ